MTNFNEMGKVELRAACKAAGVKYGNLNNDGMRAALAALEVVQTPAVKSEPAPAPQPKPTHSIRAKTAGEVVVQKSLKIEKGRPKQNGVTKPSLGSICREIWDALDAVRVSSKSVPTFEVVRDLMRANSWQRNTAYTQYQRWKQFNGVVVAAPEADEEGAE